MKTDRETKIRRWFDMWLEKQDSGIDALFAADAVYIESWGPKYVGVHAITHWFNEWNRRGTVISWPIKQVWHRDNTTVVEWHFVYKMADGDEEKFDGISLVEWDENEKITLLKEFGCKLPHYDPYANGDEPELKNLSMWT